MIVEYFCTSDSFKHNEEEFVVEQSFDLISLVK